jgi:hypothetical protein
MLQHKELEFIDILWIKTINILNIEQVKKYYVRTLR